MASDNGKIEKYHPISEQLNGADVLTSGIPAEYREVLSRRLGISDMELIEQSGTADQERRIDDAILNVFRFGNELSRLTQSVDYVHSDVQARICPDEVYAGWEDVLWIGDQITRLRSALLGFSARLFHK